MRRMRVRLTGPARAERIAAALGSLAVLVLAGLAAGCAPSVGSADENDLRNPLVQRAIAKEREGDAPGALQDYLAALDRNPRLARAHLGAAFLLDKPHGDLVAAIYHYRRYIELHPQTEKRDMIEGLIRKAMATLVHSADPSGEGARSPGLEAENAALRKELQSLKVEIRTLTNELAAIPRRPVLLAPKPAARLPAIRTHTVQYGDSLSRIAAKMYDDAGRWKDIRDANREILGNGDRVEYGQILVIPP